MVVFVGRYAALQRKAHVIDQKNDQFKEAIVSDVSEELIAAYLKTEYWVTEISRPFKFMLNRDSSDLLRLLGDVGCSTAAFISGYNPYSTRHSEDFNEKAHNRLRCSLEKHAIDIVEGFGRDPDKMWPEEKSILAIGISRECATEIGMSFHQTAIIWIEQGLNPRLIIL